MTDLRSQLRTYLEGTEPVDPMQVALRAKPAVSGTPPWRRRLLTIGVAAIVALLIVGLPMLILLLDRDESATSAPTTAAPTTMANPSTTLPGSTTVAPLDLTPAWIQQGWIRLSDLETGLAGFRPRTVLATDDGLVLLADDRSTGLGAVFVSNDGWTWEPAGTVISGGRPNVAVPSNLEGMTSVGGRLIALRSSRAMSDTRASVLVGELSESGLTWTPGASFEGACCFQDIAGNGETVVVVAEGAAGGPGIWVSSDGLEWVRVPPEQVPGGDAQHGLSWVAPAEPGFVGSAFTTRPTVYVSTDGLEWFRSAEFADTGFEAPTEPQAALFVGDTDAGTWLICAAPDGITWGCDVTGGSQQVRTLEAAPGGGYVAVVGSHLAVSNDAVEWVWTPEIGALEGATVANVVTWEGRLIVVGSDGDSGAVWTWAPASP